MVKWVMMDERTFVISETFTCSSMQMLRDIMHDARLTKEARLFCFEQGKVSPEIEHGMYEALILKKPNWVNEWKAGGPTTGLRC